MLGKILAVKGKDQIKVYELQNCLGKDLLG